MKYRALRIISTIFKVLGWVGLVLGILSTCGWSVFAIISGSSLGSLLGEEAGKALGGAGVIGGIVMAIVIFVLGLIGTGLYSLLLFAASDGFQVVLAIEENTRAMVEAFGRRS